MVGMVTPAREASGRNERKAGVVRPGRQGRTRQARRCVAWHGSAGEVGSAWLRPTDRGGHGEDWMVLGWCGRQRAGGAVVLAGIGLVRIGRQREGCVAWEGLAGLARSVQVSGDVARQARREADWQSSARQGRQGGAGKVRMDWVRQAWPGLAAVTREGLAGMERAAREDWPAAAGAAPLGRRGTAGKTGSGWPGKEQQVRRGLFGHDRDWTGRQRRERRGSDRVTSMAGMGRQRSTRSGGLARWR